MKNKGFTLIELIISVIIFVVIISFILTAVKTVSDDTASELGFVQYDPVVESAEAQKKIASEMERQNDLMERQLKIQEANQTPERE